MVRIEQVYPGGIAAELGLAAGDALVAVNGQPVRDLIDVQLCEREEHFVLDVLRADGEAWELDIEKDAEEPLGCEVEHPEPLQCGNHCIFCFVHQLPRGMRRSLYVKDEDYRFSYLYGAYVTLANIREEELERIIQQQLSPLYVSVHASDAAVRSQLLGKDAPPVLPLLQRLASAGIEVHTQVVLCPGVNDGDCLDRTIRDLYALGPQIATLAVVPVGLTGHRERLFPLRPLTSDEAARTLETIHAFQERFLVERGSRFVFAADELYLQADQPLPPLESYEQLSQVENGVGLIPLFRDQADQVLAVAEPIALASATLVTGVSFAPELERFAARLSARTGVKLSVRAVENRFFSGAVSVAGLVTGADILAQLAGAPLGDAVLLPDVMFRDGEDVLLDDLPLAELERRLGVRTFKVDSSPWGILDTLEELVYRLDEDMDI